MALPNIEEADFKGKNVLIRVDFNVELMRIRALISNKHGLHSLTLHDVQNVMCEFSKYCRAILGEGNPKTIYKTETEF